ncbi:MAG TPA: HAD-IIIC family phosphatase [Bryobacteraceae bacterium]|nr:HAD-IIIC family phosphatase [Bryobacteraceae bacterium]
MPPENLTPSPQPTPANETPFIAVTATFTAEALEPVLKFWMRELGWEYGIRFAPYNQVFQQLLDPSGLLARNRGGVNVVLLRFEDWARFDNRPLAALEENVRQFAESLHGAAAAFPSPVLVVVCPASPAFLAAPERAEFLARTKELLRAGIRDLPAVHLVTPAEIDALYPVADLHDPHGDELGRLPYTPAYFAALGTMLARRIHALRTVPFKVVALDCDETLWAGICGEDGPQGVVVDPPRRALQEFMLARQREGMLLCLASKNNEEDVFETFRAHPEMPLKPEHFVAHRINWESKAGNLSALADDLDLGLDSFIFVDDNPKECTEVQAGCPEVLALALPADAAEIPGFLDHVWAFDRIRLTREDRGRTALYAQQAERRRSERQASSLEDFLASLKLEVRVAHAEAADLPRVAQLTQRTNQMNATTVRRSEAEIDALLHAGAECLVAHVSDRFGSYGLTGAILFHSTADAIEVDTFLLSCRALGRGVEHRMSAVLGELALSRGIPRVDVPFMPTQRNRPALLFLESVGATYAVCRGEGIDFRFPAECAAKVVYKPSPRAPRPASVKPAVPENNGRGRIDYVRIATELRNPERVLEFVRAGEAPRTAGFNHTAAPSTELERNLAAIWKELLNLKTIGVHDNFFDLGGHSLLAVQLLSRVRQAFGVELSLEVVYSGEFTIAELAKAMELKQIEQAGSDEYAALLKELEGLSDEEVRAMLAEAEGPADAAR